MSLQVKVIAEINLSVFLRKFKGSSLKFSIIEHCLAKNKLNNSDFLLKSDTYLLYRTNERMQGIFVVV